MKITSYEGLCNLGANMESIYKNALAGCSDCFTVLEDYIKPDFFRVGIINSELPEIKDKNYNTRCNSLILKKEMQTVCFNGLRNSV